MCQVCVCKKQLAAPSAGVRFSDSHHGAVLCTLNHHEPVRLVCLVRVLCTHRGEHTQNRIPNSCTNILSERTTTLTEEHVFFLDFTKKAPEMHAFSAAVRLPNQAYIELLWGVCLVSQPQLFAYVIGPARCDSVPPCKEVHQSFSALLHRRDTAVCLPCRTGMEFVKKNERLHR